MSNAWVHTLIHAGIVGFFIGCWLLGEHQRKQERKRRGLNEPPAHGSAPPSPRS